MRSSGVRSKGRSSERRVERTKRGLVRWNLAQSCAPMIWWKEVDHVKNINPPGATDEVDAGD